MRLFLLGTEGYSGSEAEAKWLSGELNRIRYVDSLYEEVPATPGSAAAIRQEMRQALVPTIAQTVESAWVERIKKHALEPEFLKTWARAQELLAHRQPDPKSCLAEAYMVLAKPEGTDCTDPPGIPGPEIAFLKSRGGEINTRTVREYAEELWRGYYREMCGERGAPPPFNFGPTLAHTQWWRLFKELGLTAEFLPRDPGGRSYKNHKLKKF